MGRQLTPAQVGALTRVVDVDLGGRHYIAGHHRTIQSLMRLGLATYPGSGYYGFGSSSSWRHAVLTPLGESLSADLNGLEDDDGA